MSVELIGVLWVALFFVLLAVRVPIAIAMGLIGLGGGAVLNGWSATAFITGGLPFSSVFPYGLSVVPLFVLMGTLALETGTSRNLYDAGNAAFGNMRGGLSMGTIAACAGFGAICGSSLATAATMGRISIPEMRARGYDEGFAAATVAAGGTLGVLIPPSIILVIYALLTEQSIGRLFVAALIPGLIATVLYVIAIVITVRLRPALAPVHPLGDLRSRIAKFVAAWPIVLLFGVVLGGLFAGLFSPTEAASVGVVGMLTLGFARRCLGLDALLRAARDAAQLTGMIFLILIGAAIFNSFVEASQVTARLAELIIGADLTAWQVITVILLLYIVLGCFMDSVSMIFLTLPFVYPIVQSYDMDPIWFGVLLLSVVEIGLITPPVGMNLFIVKASTPQLPMRELYAAILPFLAADILRLILIAAVPALSLTLVAVLYGG
ncbi:TRAP transporter large permease [Pseudosulfitobacter pseudonitzschiae]|uniref:TRAP transporter large permease n=1 Tax=Pseudosulfitobacter pseudonitzschiae TaxID=1402135 RepID=UPI001AF24420|nr:TRAP transporter large permease [Pseudosulfitobacter pseudonitzschiae]MBM1816363.1 TRAP transporter large permease [Pseudosulfitobacter pseudonitzschiae]MBM1832961.1 TRAP transporter large permease [Pseudosulfitobacter pseudonitzschiae]MBM1837829.1 TRAP transporter large permease [Pseudosulfitobacter pseudonitzschiae]MBM1843090.1 TRAP transporter large permease [Pseudosulfitobacter pseudonitzschiae]MBM1847956.1 TRAP transporter large permease [Pseudosulfitobacter pseudonitzschiae]